MFPHNGSSTRRLAFLRGVRAGSRVPTSSVISRRSDFQPPLSPRFVSFAWQYQVRRSVSFDPRERRRWSPGVGNPVPHRDVSPGDGWISQVPGEPVAGLPVFFDPGRTPVSCPWRDRRAAPADGTTEAPTIRHFRGSIARLSNWLSTLRPGSYPPGRKTRFRLLARLCRAGFSPARFH